jgi:broad specificity phosphatase PhoE
MRTTIYLIRHGQVYNPNKILYGRLPHFGLSETGKKQIEETAAFLKDKQIDEIFSSPLLRARQTAGIIVNELKLHPLHFSKLLIEVKTSYQGRKQNTLDKLQSQVYLKPLNPSDETIEQLANRMKKFIQQIQKNYPGKHIVAVSHGDPLMALKAVIKKRPLEFYSFKTDQYVQHGEVYQITIDDNNLSLINIFKPQ